MTTLKDIDHAVTIAATREHTWMVLTQPPFVEAWLGCMGFQPEVGALFHMQPNAERRAAGSIEGATHCEVEAIEAPDRLRFSWFMPDTPKTHVDILLSGEAAGPTTARLVHSGWAQFAAEDVRAIHQMLDGGWRSFVLPNLKQGAETTHTG